MTLPIEQAQSIPVDHRRPLPVDGQTWWRVEAGELEVFDRGPGADGAEDAPVHLYSVPAGAFLLKPEADAWVTGLPGTMGSVPASNRRLCGTLPGRGTLSARLGR